MCLVQLCDRAVKEGSAAAIKGRHTEYSNAAREEECGGGRAATRGREGVLWVRVHEKWGRV